MDKCLAANINALLNHSIDLTPISSGNQGLVRYCDAQEQPFLANYMALFEPLQKTLGQIWQQINQALGSQTQPLDLDKEAQLDPAVVNNMVNNMASHMVNKGGDPIGGGDVLLTGACGFVGCYVLANLLTGSEVKVVCLQRDKTAELGALRLKTQLQHFGLWQPAFASRIEVQAGDLAKPQLGLADNIYQPLCQSIGQVYHCATHMAHLASYQQMKATNVDGLNQILKFVCQQRSKQLDYISTIGIFEDQRDDQGQATVITESSDIDSLVHYQDDGYLATKWVAEKLVLKAIQSGVHVNIHRLGLVCGDESHGKIEVCQWLGKLMFSCLNTGVCFIEPLIKVSLNPVDFVAKAIIALAGSSEGGEIFHINHPQGVSFAELVKSYNINAKKPLRMVPFEQFISELKRHIDQGMDIPIAYMFAEHLQGRSSGSACQNNRHAVIYDSSITQVRLLRLGLYYPPIDSSRIIKMFEAALAHKSL